MLSLVVMAGCAAPPATFAPAVSQARVSAAERVVGDRLNPFEAGGAWGHMGAEGRVILPVRYDSAFRGTSRRPRGGGLGLPGPAGRLRDPASVQPGRFSDGRAAIEQDGPCGDVGPDGALRIEPTYVSAQFSRGPLTLVTDATGSRSTDRHGRPVRPSAR